MADLSSDDDEPLIGYCNRDTNRPFLESDDSEIGYSDYRSTDSDSDALDNVPLSAITHFNDGGDGNRKTAPTTTTSTTNVEKSGWCNNMSPIDILPFNEQVGPVHTLSDDKAEKDFFQLIFPEDLYQFLADQTNTYALKCQAVKPDPKWTDVNAEEIRVFIGMHILMSVMPLPAYKDYWTRDSLCQIPAIAKIMIRCRFEKIQQYFHCNDVDNPLRGEPGHDHIHHVRPIFDIIQRKLQENYNLHKSVSVDEAMIPFRGRLSFRQYMPAKPCKFGIKVWELADSTNGYVYKMQVYTGKSENGTREEGLASRVVTDLTRCLVGKNHHVYMDNFFTSPALFEKLLAEHIYATGTCRVNRKGWPQSLHSKCLPKQKGASKTLQKNNLVATCWFDKRQVNFLSTHSNPTVIVEMKRKQKDGSIQNIPAPEVVGNYSENMNGVDHGDQLRLQYPSGRRSKKFWKYLFWFLVDTAIASSFILMRESPNHQLTSRSGKVKTRSQVEFRRNLARSLIGQFRQKRRYSLTERDGSGRSHWPVIMPKRGRCKQCLIDKIRRESIYGCSICSVNLCVICFEKFHSSIMEE